MLNGPPFVLVVEAPAGAKGNVLQELPEGMKNYIAAKNVILIPEELNVPGVFSVGPSGDYVMGDVESETEIKGKVCIGGRVIDATYVLRPFIAIHYSQPPSIWPADGTERSVDMVGGLSRRGPLSRVVWIEALGLRYDPPCAFDAGNTKLRVDKFGALYSRSRTPEVTQLRACIELSPHEGQYIEIDLLVGHYGTPTPTHCLIPGARFGGPEPLALGGWIPSGGQSPLYTGSVATGNGASIRVENNTIELLAAPGPGLLVALSQSGARAWQVYPHDAPSRRNITSGTEGLDLSWAETLRTPRAWPTGAPTITNARVAASGSRPAGTLEASPAGLKIRPLGPSPPGMTSWGEPFRVLYSVTTDGPTTERELLVKITSGEIPAPPSSAIVLLGPGGSYTWEVPPPYELAAAPDPDPEGSPVTFRPVARGALLLGRGTRTGNTDKELQIACGDVRCTITLRVLAPAEGETTECLVPEGERWAPTYYGELFCENLPVAAPSVRTAGGVVLDRSGATGPAGASCLFWHPSGKRYSLVISAPAPRTMPGRARSTGPEVLVEGDPAPAGFPEDGPVRAKDGTVAFANGARRQASAVGSDDAGAPLYCVVPILETLCTFPCTQLLGYPPGLALSSLGKVSVREGNVEGSVILASGPAPLAIKITGATEEGRSLLLLSPVDGGETLYTWPDGRGFSMDGPFGACVVCVYPPPSPLSVGGAVVAEEDCGPASFPLPRCSGPSALGLALRRSGGRRTIAAWPVLSDSSAEPLQSPLGKFVTVSLPGGGWRWDGAVGSTRVPVAWSYTRDSDLYLDGKGAALALSGEAGAWRSAPGDDDGVIITRGTTETVIRWVGGYGAWSVWRFGGEAALGRRVVVISPDAVVRVSVEMGEEVTCPLVSLPATSAYADAYASVAISASQVATIRGLTPGTTSFLLSPGELMMVTVNPKQATYRCTSIAAPGLPFEIPVGKGASDCTISEAGGLELTGELVGAFYRVSVPALSEPAQSANLTLCARGPAGSWMVAAQLLRGSAAISTFRSHTGELDLLSAAGSLPGAEVVYCMAGGSTLLDFSGGLWSYPEGRALARQAAVENARAAPTYQGTSGPSDGPYALALVLSDGVLHINTGVDRPVRLVYAVRQRSGYICYSGLVLMQASTATIEVPEGRTVYAPDANGPLRFLAEYVQSAVYAPTKSYSIRVVPAAPPSRGDFHELATRGFVTDPLRGRPAIMAWAPGGAPPTTTLGPPLTRGTYNFGEARFSRPDHSIGGLDVLRVLCGGGGDLAYVEFAVHFGTTWGTAALEQYQGGIAARLPGRIMDLYCAGPRGWERVDITDGPAALGNSWSVSSAWTPLIPPGSDSLGEALLVFTPGSGAAPVLLWGSTSHHGTLTLEA